MTELSPTVNEARKALPDYGKLTLRQLIFLAELTKSGGQQSEVAARFKETKLATVNRDLIALADCLNIENFGESDSGAFKSSDEVQALMHVLGPLFKTLERLTRKDMGRVVHIAGGDSLLTWLIGSRVTQLRKLCSQKEGYGNRNLEDVSLQCTPMSNRSILAGVSNGVLHFGLIRQSLLNHAKYHIKRIQNHPLGEVRYGLAVSNPDSFSRRGGFTWEIGKDGFLVDEDKILTTQFFTTVGPDGEFRENLDAAIKDSKIDVKIEFSYSGFPQTLPHIFSETHIGICPIVTDWGAVIPNVVFYPLKLISGYTREISLIYHESLIPKWIPREQTAELLKLSNYEKPKFQSQRTETRKKRGSSKE